MARVSLKIAKVRKNFIMNLKYHSYSNNLKKVFFKTLIHRYLLFNIGYTGVLMMPKGLRFLTCQKSGITIFRRMERKIRQKLCGWKGINGPIQSFLLCFSWSFTCRTYGIWFRWKFSLLWIFLPAKSETIRASQKYQ